MGGWQQRIHFRHTSGTLASRGKALELSTRSPAAMATQPISLRSNRQAESQYQIDTDDDAALTGLHRQGLPFQQIGWPAERGEARQTQSRIGKVALGRQPSNS